MERRVESETRRGRRLDRTRMNLISQRRQGFDATSSPHSPLPSHLLRRTPFDCLRSIINNREHVKVDSLRLIQQGKRDCRRSFPTSSSSSSPPAFLSLVEREGEKESDDDDIGRLFFVCVDCVSFLEEEENDCESKRVILLLYYSTNFTLISTNYTLILLFY